MIVLGLETSAKWGGAALAGPDGLLAETGMIGGGRTENIQRLIDSLFHSARKTPRELGGISVSLGPGSFTGLRIGLGAAKGMALALECPILGIPLLPLIAAGAHWWSGDIAVWIDAGRGEVHGGLFRDRLAITEAVTAPISEHLRLLDGRDVICIGSGAGRYEQEISDRFGDRVVIDGEAPSTQLAGALALTGRRRITAGESSDMDTLEPIYLRGADAKLPGTP